MSSGSQELDARINRPAASRHRKGRLTSVVSCIDIRAMPWQIASGKLPVLDGKSPVAAAPGNNSMCSSVLMRGE